VKKPLQIACASLLLAALAFPAVYAFPAGWVQLVTFALGVLVVSILFFFGKRWLDGHA
jgi:hypothetical protein